MTGEAELELESSGSVMDMWRARLLTRIKESGWKALAVGQVLSLLVTSTGFTSALLARNGIDAPTTQSLLNYLLLATVYGSIFLYRKKKLQISLWIYVLLALLDVEANYLAVKAYQYTSITSVMLLDCWSIPCVLILTWLALKTQYAIGHFVGVTVCVVGLVLVIFSDVHDKDRSSGSNVILGDILVIGASIMYGFTNVSEEFVVKTVDQVEFLAHIGCFGALISACQLYVLEWGELQSIHWTGQSIAPFIGFAIACFGFASLVPTVLKMNGSTMLNLSLLTSDMWAVLVRVLGFHESVDSLYFVAFGTVAVGLIVYAVAGEPVAKPVRGAHSLLSLEGKYEEINQGETEMVIDQAEVEESSIEEDEFACLSPKPQKEPLILDETAPLHAAFP
jgi:solute carrier family 35 protein F1/2